MVLDSTSSGNTFYHNINVSWTRVRGYMKCSRDLMNIAVCVTFATHLSTINIIKITT